MGEIWTTPWREEGTQCTYSRSYTPVVKVGHFQWLGVQAGLLLY